MSINNILTILIIKVALRVESSSSPYNAGFVTKSLILIMKSATLNPNIYKIKGKNNPLYPNL